MDNTKVIDTIAMIANEYAKAKLNVLELEPNDFGIAKFDEKVIAEITNTLAICLAEMGFGDIKINGTLASENLLIEISELK